MGDRDVLERGAAWFFVRPRVMVGRAYSLADVQRMFVVLRPDGDHPCRRVVIGRKRLPDPARRDRQWAYVDRVGASIPELLADKEPESYDTKTQGFRSQEAAREPDRRGHEPAREGTRGAPPERALALSRRAAEPVRGSELCRARARVPRSRRLRARPRRARRSQRGPR